MHVFSSFTVTNKEVKEEQQDSDTNDKDETLNNTSNSKKSPQRKES